MRDVSALKSRSSMAAVWPLKLNTFTVRTYLPPLNFTSYTLTSGEKPAATRRPQIDYPLITNAPMVIFTANRHKAATSRHLRRIVVAQTRIDALQPLAGRRPYHNARHIGAGHQELAAAVGAKAAGPLELVVHHRTTDKVASISSSGADDFRRFGFGIGASAMVPLAGRCPGCWWLIVGQVRHRQRFDATRLRFDCIDACVVGRMPGDETNMVEVNVLAPTATIRLDGAPFPEENHAICGSGSDK